jgi:putative SOS response-associated peptidase YedK
MPVIIEPELYDRWLDNGAEEKNLLSLFTPFPDKNILAYPVGTEVNNPRNDNPSCLIQL